MTLRMKCIVAGLALAFAATTAQAETKNLRITNNSGATARDLHLTFTGTGGDLAVRVLSAPGACGDPVIAITGGGNTGEIDWLAECVPAGGVVIVQARTASGPLAVSSGQWTFDAPDPPVAITVGTDVAETAIPTVSQWGLIILTLLLLTAATIIFARRRPAVAHAR